MNIRLSKYTYHTYFPGCPTSGGPVPGAEQGQGWGGKSIREGGGGDLPISNTCPVYLITLRHRMKHAGHGPYDDQHGRIPYTQE